MADDFVRTIDSDAEIPSEDEFPQEKHKNTGRQPPDKVTTLNPDFTFDPTGDTYHDVFNEYSTLEDVVRIGSKPVSSLSHCVPSRLTH